MENFIFIKLKCVVLHEECTPWVQPWSHDSMSFSVYLVALPPENVCYRISGEWILPPQNMPLWHIDYFKLVIIKEQQT